ncbi:hypothetical protein [Sphingobacterium siyangense]|uniref:hypothetical protein n=1 Tax=Sphingobacterium siyangense TaxID=459529 RepID=UPI003C743B44
MKHINKQDITRSHDLTVEEIKALSLFSHFNDEQATEVIHAIKGFVQIVTEHYLKDHKNHNNTTDF